MVGNRTGGWTSAAAARSRNHDCGCRSRLWTSMAARGSSHDRCHWGETPIQINGSIVKQVWGKIPNLLSAPSYFMVGCEMLQIRSRSQTDPECSSNRSELEPGPIRIRTQTDPGWSPDRPGMEPRPIQNGTQTDPRWSPARFET